MEVRRIMIIVVHEYDNAVKAADLRDVYFPYLLSCSQHIRSANVELSGPKHAAKRPEENTNKYARRGSVPLERLVGQQEGPTGRC
jgi:hypothetical protein